MRSSCAVGAISCLLVAGVAADYRVSAQERLKHSNPSDQSPTIYNRPADEVLKMPANQGTELGGTSWRLLKFHGSEDSNLTPDDKTKYTIAFGTDGRVTARIDCNRGMGTWKSLGPNQIQFGALALTRAMCPSGSLNDQIAKNWKFVRSYTIKDGHLFLSLMADGGIYEFESVGGSQSSALGKRWRLMEINEAAVRTTKPYIEFDVNAKRFSGNGGCNRIAGSFEVDGMHIRFSQAISTRLACIDKDIQQVETDFLKRLEEATEFQIQGEVLRLYAGDRPILTFRADTQPRQVALQKKRA